MMTPYMAAKSGIGESLLIVIERYKLDGTRCGMAQGRHAAWNRAYRVGEKDSKERIDMGRGLVEARRMAATMGAAIVEVWPGGQRWIRGKNGGLSRVPS